MKKTLLKLFFTLVLCYGMNLQSQTVNLSPEKDNSIYSENNNSNALGNLFSGRTNNGNNRRALIKFDLSSIPSGSSINSVSLTVNVNRVPTGGAGTQTYTIHQLSRDWGEGTSNGGGTGSTATANDATWNNAMQGTSTWTNPGGDFSASPMASLAITGNGSYTFTSNANFVAAVQNWLDTPNSNNGLILIGDESVARSARRFDSREGTNVPQLSISYTTLSTNRFETINFSMFPNPTNNQVSLKLPKHISEAQLNIYDVLGKQVENRTISNEERVDISKLEKGIYMLEVSSLGKAKTKRLVKL